MNFIRRVFRFGYDAQRHPMGLERLARTVTIQNRNRVARVAVREGHPPRINNPNQATHEVVTSRHPTQRPIHSRDNFSRREVCGSVIIQHGTQPAFSPPPVTPTRKGHRRPRPDFGNVRLPGIPLPVARCPVVRLNCIPTTRPIH